MLLYFDRIQSYSNFVSERKNSSSNLNSSLQDIDETQDLDGKSEGQDNMDLISIIHDFMYRHHQKGGPLLTFALVYDAEQGSAPTFERGFIVENDDDDSTEGVDGLQSWPAIFLRSTRGLMKSTVDVSPGRRKTLTSIGEKEPLMGLDKKHWRSNSHGTQSSIDSDDSKSTDFGYTHWEHKSSFSIMLEAVKDGGKGSDIQLLETGKEHEYWAASRMEWPNSIWHNVVSLFVDASRQSEAFTVPFTHRDRSVDGVSRECSDVKSSAYHFVQLSSKIWLTVLVKEKNCENSQRRKGRGMDDGDIHNFINLIASKLSFSAIVSAEAIVAARKSAESLQRDDDDEQKEPNHPCFFC